MNRVWFLVKPYWIKYRILRFMVVGGLGYLIVFAIYYPLILLFQAQVTFLGKQFYLLPFAVSLIVASICTYLMCKKWVFGDKKENSLGPLRFSFLVGTTVMGDLVILFLLVELLHLGPILSAIIAVWAIFIVKYGVAGRWIWS